MLTKLLNSFGQFFGYSKNETRGVLLLLIIVLLLIVGLSIQKFIYINSYKPVQFVFDSNQTHTNDIISDYKNNHNYENSFENQTTALDHKINLDNLKINDLEILGISKKLSFTLINYLKKGGKIRQATDLNKIYGMDELSYKILINNIQWENKSIEKTQVNSMEIPTDKIIKPKSENVANININTADTSELKKINGIGSILAVRILKYRNKLGGFVYKDQYEEIYGISEYGIKELKNHSFISSEFTPIKINLNQADYKMLSAHPYIGYSKTKVLMNYIKQHKKIKDLKELVSTMQFSEKEATKLEPYIIFE